MGGWVGAEGCDGGVGRGGGGWVVGWGGGEGRCAHPAVSALPLVSALPGSATAAPGGRDTPSVRASAAPKAGAVAVAVDVAVDEAEDVDSHVAQAETGGTGGSVGSVCRGSSSLGNLSLLGAPALAQGGTGPNQAPLRSITHPSTTSRSLKVKSERPPCAIPALPLPPLIAVGLSEEEPRCMPLPPPATPLPPPDMPPPAVPPRAGSGCSGGRGSES